jgi:hypothetical protein
MFLKEAVEEPVQWMRHSLSLEHFCTSQVAIRYYRMTAPISVRVAR